METSAIKAALILQCASCRTIVGDTLSFVAADPETNSLAISGRRQGHLIVHTRGASGDTDL
jgi:hypothetical protein